MTRGSRPPSFDPLRRAVAAVTAATLALAGAVVLVTGPQAAPSSAAVGQCPDPGQFPGIGNLPPAFTDNNVAVYTGGNFLATGSASEAEGVLVVGGDATFNRTLSGSSFNVGTVGAGSQIAPDPGTVMLHVGGTLDVVAPTNVLVGAGYQDQGGGDVQVGATKTGAGTADTNNGELRQNLGEAAALAPFGDFGDQVAQASTAFAGLTGTPAAVAGNIATFDGSTSSALHVFTVDAAALNGVNELNFNGFTDDAPIVINVVGGPVDFQPNYFAADNVRFDDFSSPDFGNWASRIMWNFVDADAVQLGPAGAAQFMGSVMAPAADVQLYNHMNGRVYVGGDLTFGGEGSQSGLEIHNYPWIGPGPFNCVPTSSFVVQKTVTGAAAAAVPAGTVFTVHYSYVTPAPDSETGEGDLEVPLNGNLVAGPDLPVGTVVTISEPTLPTVPGVSWGSPVFRVNGDVVGDPASFTVVDGAMMTVSVVNTANVGGPVGGFSVQKAPLQGNAAGAVDPATEYQVDWTATLPEGATYDGDLSGTLTVLAGGAVVDGPQDLPVGTTVTFTEVTPDPVDGVVWATPVVEPSTVTVGEGQDALVTVTNTATSQVGGFTVVKIVNGNAAGLVPGDTAFTVTWTADIPDGVVYEGETTGEGVILADGTVYAGPVDLPVGTVVTVTEVAPPAIDGVVWGTPSISPAELTVGQGQPAVVQVTNTASTVNGGFTVHKELLGNASGAVPGDTAFLVDWAATLPTGVAYGGPLEGTVTVLADGTVVDGPQDLPVGTVVTFAEQTPLPEIDGVQWGSPIISPESLVVSENGGQPAAVTVTNVATSVVGGFTLSKALAGNAAGAVPDDTEFLVDWSAVLPEGVTYDGALSGTLTVLADGTVVDGPQDLPVGTSVAFSEQTPLPAVPNVVWGEPSFDPGAEVTITENGGEAVGITVTNTATSTVGGFAVAKDVVGDAEGLVPETTPFSVTWVATLPAGVTYDGSLTGTLTVLADGTVVDGPQDLPVGTTVTFSETTLPTIPNVVWGEPSFDPATLTVTETGDTPTLVTVTNTASSVVGGFTLQKDVQGNAAGIVPDITTFTVTWTAVPPPDVTYDGPLTGTLTVRADGTVVDGPADLPVGTVVTFVEQTPLPEVGDVVWGPPSFTPAQLTVTENDGDPVAVTVTNTANAVVGSFGVAKAVAGNAAGLVPRDTAFLVDWSVEIPDGVDYDGDLSGTLTVLADGTVVDGPADLPVGTVVTLSEQSPLPEVDGVVWGTPSYDPGTTVTISENAGPVVVTLTNTATTVDGGFSVAKALTGNAAGLVPGDTAFLVDWSAVLPDGVTYAGPLTGTVTVLASGAVVDGPQDLPVGTTVTFTERTPLPPVDGVVWGVPTFAPASTIVVVQNGGDPVTVTVTNTATTVNGGFTVAKAVTGNAAGLVPDDTEFVVGWTAVLPEGVTYPGPLTGTVTVLADGTVVDGPVDLPVGTAVAFSEQEPLPAITDVVWGTPTFAPGAEVTIVEGATGVELTVTNTATSVVGGFSLQKSVIGDAAGIVPDDTAFSVTWVATLPPDVTYDGFLTGTLTVLADGTVVDGPQDLPVGTTVTFTEATPPAVPDVTWGAVSVDPAQLTITESAGGPTAVTVTNTANAVTGSFGVAKALAGNAAGVVPDDTAFLVDWSATLPDGVTYPGPLTGTLTVLADGTIADGPADLPVGTVVTFAEQTPLPDVPDVVWGSPEISPESVTIAEGDEPAVVTVTNTATSVVGGFAVAKALAGNAAGVVPDDTEFLVSWSATLPDAVTYDDPLTGTLTVLADGTVVDGPQDLPVGTVVTFAETGLPSIPDVEWGAPVFSPESVTITETGDAPTEVTVTNTATSAVGGFSLQKVVDGDSAGVVPDDTAFLVDWTATLPDAVTYGGELTGTATLLADGTVVDGPQDLPVGTVVTFAEQTPLAEVPGVAWGEPSVDPDGGLTITENGGEPVTVTVTNTAGTVLGTFTVAKALTGAAAGAVPEDTAFTVTWSATVPDGVAFDGPTSGTLAVLADGTVVDGPELPYGTAVTLAEPTFPDVPGIAWGTPSFDPATVVVGAADAPVAVTVTNTAVARAGGFTVHKEVAGDAASLVPGDTAFELGWTAALPAGVGYDGATEGTLTVLADGTVVAGPQDLPAGTVVTLTERTPLPEVPGVLWGEPAFAVDGVAVDPATLTVAADTTVAVALTNTANDAHLVGGFAVHKVVDGSAAARVPDDTAFTVTWTADVPGGTLYDGPTSGRLTVRADGTVVTGPADLPEGTVVTLGEVDLPGIDGVRWGTPVFAVDGQRSTALTVAVGEVADVTLTNTASTTGGLAVTGATTGGLVGLGALLVLGGAALLAVTRRRTA
ncbi:DUF5979 domain-containing protein [Cellulosimicrobium protaetiae]